MTIVKIHPIYKTIQSAMNYILDEHKIVGRNVEPNLERSLDYISDDMKTTIKNKSLISSFGCNPTNATDRFLYNQKLWGNPNKKVLARHLIQSFDPGSVTPEDAHQMGKKLIDQVTGGENYYVIATHTDKDHIHNHIIFDNVNFRTGKCYDSNKRSYRRIQRISDEICREQGLTIIPKKENTNEKSKSWFKSYADKTYKDYLKVAIDVSIMHSKDWDDFLQIMDQKFGYTVKIGKHLAFKHQRQNRFTRTRSIGRGYDEESIRQKLVLSVEQKADIVLENPLAKDYMLSDEKIDIENINTKKETKLSFRSRLKESIEVAVGQSQSIIDFYQHMEGQGYEVKYGKHLAFKNKEMKRFIRLRSLGDEFCEEAIRRRIEKRVRPKASQSEHMIDFNRNMKINIIAYRRWARKHNVKLFGKQLIELDRLGIKNISEAFKKFKDLDQQVDQFSQEIEYFSREIDTLHHEINHLSYYLDHRDNYLNVQLSDDQKKHMEQLEKYFKQQNISADQANLSEQKAKLIRLTNEKKGMLLRFEQVKADWSCLSKIVQNVEKYSKRERTKVNFVSRSALDRYE